jgi:hypothetical protein
VSSQVRNLSASSGGPAGTRRHTIHHCGHEETSDDGKRKYTVAEIAAEFGVMRPAICRCLDEGETVAAK